MSATDCFWRQVVESCGFARIWQLLPDRLVHSSPWSVLFLHDMVVAHSSEVYGDRNQFQSPTRYHHQRVPSKLIPHAQ